jgi:hypothetical protein
MSEGSGNLGVSPSPQQILNLNSPQSIPSPAFTEISYSNVQRNVREQQQKGMTSAANVKDLHAMNISIHDNVPAVEPFSVCYAHDGGCGGFCSNEMLRRVALTAVLDELIIKGPSG